MIKATCIEGSPGFESSVRGIAIYLDTFAIKRLAKGESSLRQRFVAAINSGADLLFSIANAAEISGSTGASSKFVKEFLDELGPNWYPVEMLPEEVAKREAAGVPPDKSCFAKELLQAFFKNQTFEHVAGSGRVIDLSAGFFRLGAFVDWLSSTRNKFLQKSRQLDSVISDGIRSLRVKHKRNPGWLDTVLPEPSFHPSRAATFAYVGFMRELICDSGHQIRKGDGIDFCHAVIATAFSNFAALDKQWKRRIAKLPKPNRIPRVYYEPELGMMVTDIETALANLKGAAARAR